MFGLRGRAFAAERHSKATQQLAGIVVRITRAANRNVHALHTGVLVRIELREHELFAEAQAVVPLAIEGVGVEAAEVAYARQRKRNQAIEELVHPGAAKCDLRADLEAFSQTEGCNALAGLAANWLLAG